VIIIPSETGQYGHLEVLILFTRSRVNWLGNEMWNDEAQTMRTQCNREGANSLIFAYLLESQIIIINLLRRNDFNQNSIKKWIDSEESFDSLSIFPQDLKRQTQSKEAMIMCQTSCKKRMRVNEIRLAVVACNCGNYNATVPFCWYQSSSLNWVTMVYSYLENIDHWRSLYILSIGPVSRCLGNMICLSFECCSWFRKNS
jgi:hypothetical protein